MKPELVILVGNIGTGKSTVSKEYAKKGYLVVCRDTFRYMLGAGRYRFEKHLETAIARAATTLLQALLIEGENVVIDETNMSRRRRKTLIELGKEFDYKVVACVMPDFTKSECLLNRAKDDTREYDITKWGEIWDKFDLQYDLPLFDEGFDEIIRRTEK